MPTMLVVDDDPAWRSLYRMRFEGQFEVFEAVDGLHALSLLDRVKPQIIVLDVRMPRMDGVGFLQQLERRGARTHVVLCSAMFVEGDRPQIKGVQIVPKTPDLKEIWGAVQAVAPPASSASTSGGAAGTTDEMQWRD